ncbi:MAG TPA: hypothetical protein VGJ28_11950 [Micromonosporaceae bacterium]|jgi:hypothetical protein
MARDRGSVSIMTLICMIAVTMFIALSVDGGGQIRDGQLANEFASEAARAAGQRIDLQSAIAGNPAVVDKTSGCPTCQLPYIKAANDYIRTAEAEDNVSPDSVTVDVVSNTPNTVTVTVTIAYAPRLLTLFGFHKTLTSTGTATAVLVTTA